MSGRRQANAALDGEDDRLQHLSVCVDMHLARFVRRAKTIGSTRRQKRCDGDCVG